MAGQPGFFDLSDRYEALSAAGDPLERLLERLSFQRFPGLGLDVRVHGITGELPLVRFADEAGAARGAAGCCPGQRIHSALAKGENSMPSS